jgi:rhodanese-related sulfurtransferase
MDRAKKIFNWVLNIVCIVCAAVVLWQFVHRDRSADQRYRNTVRVGSKVELSAVSWNEAPKTVVLALSTSCQYCRASAAFYRSLVDASKRGRFRTIAVLRESSQVSNPLLPSLGIDRVSDVRQADLETIGVRATPTVLVVDHGGTVRATWTGKLTVSQERDVFAKLDVDHPPEPQRMVVIADDTGAVTVLPPELRLLLAKPDTVLLDSRDRTLFEQAHIRGALNIPLDEILSRVPHELPKGETVVVYCQHLKTCGTQKKEDATMGLCNITGVALGRAGFHKVRYIADDLSILGTQGIPVVGMTCQ